MARGKRRDDVTVSMRDMVLEIHEWLPKISHQLDDIHNLRVEERLVWGLSGALSGRLVRGLVP